MLICNGSNVPSEILDRIFGHCERVFKKNRDWTRPDPSFVPSSRLHPLLLVCKEWHDVAERRLYKSVKFGSDRLVIDRNGRGRRILGRDVCKQFLETVRSNPRLASLVRELHLGAMKLRTEETDDHISLIEVCKNVEIIRLQGCGAEGLETPLKAALAKRDLISFKTSVMFLREWVKGVEVFSVAELLDIMQNWPRLEYMDAFLGEDYEFTFETKPVPLQPSLSTIQIQALRGVSISGKYILSTQLSILANMAPNLERLSLKARPDCNATFQECARIWSPTLRYLNIDINLPGGLRNDVAKNWRSACPIISSPMVALRGLRISRPLLPPKALVYFPSLEILNFRGEHPDGTELAKIIQEGNLPCLRDLDVEFSQSMDANSPVLLGGPPKGCCVETSQELRKACMPRNIFVRDVLTTMKEFEERYGADYDEPESPESADNDWPDTVPVPRELEGSDYESRSRSRSPGACEVVTVSD